MERARRAKTTSLRVPALIVALALVVTPLLGRPAGAADPGVAIVYVASGLNYPDALTGSVLAAQSASPLLIVRPMQIPDATAMELTRLAPKQIVVLGGPSAVSDAVVEELGTYTDPPGQVSRLFGADRYATAAQISQAVPGKVADADLLDGLDATAFAVADHDHPHDHRELQQGTWYCELGDWITDYWDGLQVLRQADGWQLIADGTEQIFYTACEVDVPDGARLTQLRAELFDTAADAVASIGLRGLERNGFDPVGTLYGGGSTADLRAGQSTVDVAHDLNVIVDRDEYRYLLELRLETAAGESEGQQFAHRIELDYELLDVPTATPSP